MADCLKCPIQEKCKERHAVYGKSTNFGKACPLIDALEDYLIRRLAEERK